MTKLYLYYGLATHASAGYFGPKLIGTFSSRESLWKAMVKDQKEKWPSFGYYYRSWTDDEGIENIDFGSHIYFYFISDKAL